MTEPHNPVRADAGRPRRSIPRQRTEASLTQARVDAIFQALQARREYERGVADLQGGTPPPAPPRQRTGD